MFVVQSYKTPSTVLTKKNGEFVAFGYEAEKIYSEASANDDNDDDKSSNNSNGDDDSENNDDKGKSFGNYYNQSELMLFRHFKMLLYNTEVQSNPTITPTPPPFASPNP